MPDSPDEIVSSRIFRPRFGGSLLAPWALVDASVWIGSLIAATAFRGLYVPTPVPPSTIVSAALAAIALHLALGLFFGAYGRPQVKGSYEEVLALAQAGLLVTAILTTVSVLDGRQRVLAPGSIVLVGGLSALVGMLATRVVIRSFRARQVVNSDRTPVIVIGAGSAGRLLVHNLLHDETSPYRPVAFLDDDPRKRSLRIAGIKVLGGRRDLEPVASRLGVDVAVIAIPSAEPATMRELHELGEDAGLRMLVLPRFASLLDGRVRSSDLRDINLEDLLGRPPVRLDEELIAREIVGKSVLVTGAGGSIGSELCRQISRYSPGRLIFLDRDESALHALELSLYGHGLLDSDSTVLADIRDKATLQRIFETYRPEVVFHAAALKHLPLLERYPAEAWKSNVLGTLNVLEAAAAVDVETFVNISTDKAADPASVLGYTKRIAERLTAHHASRCRGRFISVRFGNVLGSRGSVIHTFTEQINQGRPLTVTDPDVERYFMLIPEACELVLQAAALGYRDGEVLVLDMGEPVRIADVARALIDLSGRHDVGMQFCGLRPGEKLREDLFAGGEEGLPTAHPSVAYVEVTALSPAAWNGFSLDDRTCLAVMRGLAVGDADSAVGMQAEATRQAIAAVRWSEENVLRQDRVS